MSKSKYYYHLTTEAHLKDMLEQGLKCDIGDNSKKVNETEPMIYLCRRKDLPYWEILLGKTIIIQINEAGVSDAEEYDYDDYSEAVCKKDISLEHIKRVYISYDKTKAMRDLCISYLYSISRITEVAARVNTESYIEKYCKTDFKEMKECLSQLLDAFFAVSRRLDYASVGKAAVRAELKEAGEECAYTFCDTYLDTGRRLWEQLIHYPENEFTPRFKQLHAYIAKTLKGCGKVNTGGWTG